MTMTAIDTPTVLDSQTRNQVITARAEHGEDLTAIGKDYGMSRQRVHQIVAKTSTMSMPDIREARNRVRENTRDQAEALKVTEVRQAAQANPKATLSALAEITGHPLSLVRDSLDWTERERRADQQHYSSVSDDEVLGEIRRIANLPGGEPLTSTFYEDHRIEGVGVSHARLLQRFGTWTAACQAAQVTGRGPNPGRVYTRKWSEAEMVQWVWDYLNTTDSPSYARFEAWTKSLPDAPSAQTVRNTLGSWVEMKRLAIEVNVGSDN